MDTVNTGVDTSNTLNNEGIEVQTPNTENNGGVVSSTKENKDGKNEPFKVFATKEDFDKHSMGVINSAKQKAEKEIMQALGLNPNEKDKLSKFKELYENSLTEAEKKEMELKNLQESNNNYSVQVQEKDAVITALCKVTGKSVDDVSKYVKMAKGLVSADVTMDMALEEVMKMIGNKEQSAAVPTGTPPPKSTDKIEDNPFKSDNLTAQGKAIKENIEKARENYFSAYGKYPSW